MISLVQSETALTTKLLTQNFPSHQPGCKCKMSNKHNLVLYVDEELVEKTRNLGFNLSKTFENHLKHLLMQFSHANSPNNVQNTENLGDRWAGPDLNRRPSARQADVLPS